MRIVALLEILVVRAINYRCGCNASIKRNKHQNTLDGECEFTQEEIDAILVDFINYVANAYCVDYALEVSDINVKAEEKTEEECKCNDPPFYVAEEGDKE